SFLGVTLSDDEASAGERIAQHPSVIGLDAETDIPLLLQFLGIDSPDTAALSRDSRMRHSRLRQIVGHMIKQRSNEPYIIVFEDLHWLDSASAEFVAAIVQATFGTRTMLVVNFRQSYTAEWMEGPYYEQIPLGELDTAHTTALVTQLVGNHPELCWVTKRIIARCAGNPFFAEELVRSLTERGVFRGEIGNLRLGPKSDEDHLPASVQAIIGARVDGLAAQEKTVVHIAAIIGKEFPLSVIEEVANIPREQIEAIVDRLRDAQLIEPRFGSVDQEFFFRHPLMQEVAYSEQLRSRRSKLHAAVAVALERQYSSKLDEFAALIAHHHEAAGKYAVAAVFSARAAVWIGSAASGQALQHWHKVRQLLSDQPHTDVLDTLRMRASGQIAMFGWRQGMTAEEARPFIDEALDWARKIDNSMMSLLLAADGRIAVASGYSADDYVARINEALAVEDDLGNEGRIATLNALLCHANWLAGFLSEALEANDRALGGVANIDTFDEQFLGLDVEQWMQGLRGRILVRLGRFDEAEHCLQQVLAIEQSLLDPAVQFIPHLTFVDLAYFCDDPVAAKEHAARIAEIAEKGQNPYLQAYALGCVGAARFVQKDFAGGIRKLTEGVRFARSAKAALEFEPEMLASLAACHYQAGDFIQAASVAHQAIDVAQRRTARLAECRASIIYASALCAAHGDKQQAEAQARFDRAEELIEITSASAFSEQLASARALSFVNSNTSSSQEG
ncbi:MAG: adenylate/guanylate cyclase domain-containing protein, partial [Hyphomicrobiales bacterium]|nr:adenylate/guanylate cyclase domain-containing protein [Hyphomicrobiales bacterium]